MSSSADSINIHFEPFCNQTTATLLKHCNSNYCTLRCSTKRLECKMVKKAISIGTVLLLSTCKIVIAFQKAPLCGAKFSLSYLESFNIWNYSALKINFDYNYFIFVISYSGKRIILHFSTIFFFLLLVLFPFNFLPMANYVAGAANTYQPSSPCSDSDDEDFSDLEALQNESLEASRMRYKPLRSNPPRPNTGPPAMRGMRGSRGAGPRGGPRSHRGTARSYSSESSRQVVGGGNQLPATHTVSAPFPSPHLSMDGECFSLQRKWLMLSDHVLLLLLSNTTWAIE